MFKIYPTSGEEMCHWFGERGGKGPGYLSTFNRKDRWLQWAVWGEEQWSATKLLWDWGDCV